MINLDNLSLGSLLNGTVVFSEEDYALAEAVGEMLKYVFKQTSVIDFQNDIPDFLLDHIATSIHVDFYDRTLSNTQKRDLIFKNDILHQIKGTPAAIYMVLDIMNIDGEVREWFQYDGRPYHFKIETNQDFKSEKDIVKLMRLTESMKNKRSFLEAIWFKKNNGIYFVIVKDDKLRIKPAIKFYCGISMPGAVLRTSAVVNTKIKSGIGERYTGTIYSGMKKNDVNVGRVISEPVTLKTNTLYGIGEVDLLKTSLHVGTGKVIPETITTESTIDYGIGEIDVLKTSLKVGTGNDLQSQSTIGADLKSGSSNIGFCGKIYSSK